MQHQPGEPRRQQRRHCGTAVPRAYRESDRTFSSAMCQLRPVGLPRSVHRDIAVCQAPLRVAHRQRSHFSAGADREALPGARMATGDSAGDTRPHLTRRDLDADTLEDMFDFEHSPSPNTAVGIALPRMTAPQRPEHVFSKIDTQPKSGLAVQTPVIAVTLHWRRRAPSR